ncbi:HSF-type DNA-binding-domain-containing protein, partial [Fennellomyces sp. T-0311]
VKPTNTAAFVTKLYTMVEDSDEELITWSNAGDYFKVISPSNFACTVLPRYFKHRNWTSFVRQLNMYGFHKISEYRDDLEQDIWCFKHVSFYRGGKHSSHLIRRKRSQAS